MALREVIADFQLRVQGQQQLQQMDQSVSGAVGALGNLRNIIAGAAIVQGLRVAAGAAANFAREMINAGDELDKVSQQLGLSVAELQAWEFAANRAGVDAQAMRQSFTRLQRAAYDASQGQGASADAFRRLGISVRDSNGELLSGDALMRQLAGSLSGVESSTERVALAQQLMGRSGARLLPLFADGEEGAQALLDRFRELGGGMSQEMVRDAAAAQDALTDLDVATESFKSQLAVALLPALTRGINQIAEWGGSLARALRQTRIVEAGARTLRAALIAVGIVAAGIGAPIIIGFALIAAGILGAILLVEDFIVWMDGGESMIGSNLQAISEGWDGVVRSIRRAINAAAEFLGLDTPFTEAESRDLDQPPPPPGGVRAPGRARGAVGAQALSRPLPAAVAAARAGRGGSAVDARSAVTVNVNGDAGPDAIERIRRVIRDENAAQARRLSRATAQEAG